MQGFLHACVAQLPGGACMTGLWQAWHSRLLLLTCQHARAKLVAAWSACQTLVFCVALQLIL